MATIYKQGSKGTIVSLIQRALKRAGFGVAADGIWGPITTEAVKKFQQAHNLTADGIAGPATLAALGVQAVTTSQALKPNNVMQRGDVVLKKSRRHIDYIVLHCTATREGQAQTVEQIRAEHKRQGWADIGYHYVVTIDGQLHLGRDVDIAGAHVSGHNQNSIGIAYVGGLENNPKKTYAQLQAKDTRTDAQKATLLSLLMDLRRLYPYAKIVGHRDLSPDKNGNGTIEPSEWIKQCPSFDAPLAYRNI